MNLIWRISAFLRSSRNDIDIGIDHDVRRSANIVDSLCVCSIKLLLDLGIRLVGSTSMEVARRYNAQRSSVQHGLVVLHDCRLEKMDEEQRP